MLLVQHVDDIVDGDGTEQPSALVHDGRFGQCVLAEEEGHVFLVHVHRDQFRIRIHDFAERYRPPGAEQFRQLQRTDGLPARVDDDQIVEIIGQFAFVGPHVVDGLTDAPEFRHRHGLVPHQAAGAVFRIGKALLVDQPVIGRQGIQQFLLVRLVQILQQVDRIVGLHVGDQTGEMVRIQIIDNVLADRIVHIGEDFGVHLLAEGIDDGFALTAGEPFHEVGDIGCVERLQKVPDPPLVIRGQGLIDRVRDFLGQAVEVVERVVRFCTGRLLADRFFLHISHK